jgi:hypothetical protein
MIRPIVKLACAALLGAGVLLAPGPEAAQAAPVAAAPIAEQAGSSPLIEKTYYYRGYYRRPYYRPYYRPYHRPYYHRRYYRW